MECSRAISFIDTPLFKLGGGKEYIIMYRSLAKTDLLKMLCGSEVHNSELTSYNS